MFMGNEKKSGENQGVYLSYKTVWAVIGLIVALALLLAFFLGRSTVGRPQTTAVPASAPSPAVSSNSPTTSQVPLLQTSGVEQGKPEFTPVQVAPDPPNPPVQSLQTYQVGLVQPVSPAAPSQSFQPSQAAPAQAAGSIAPQPVSPGLSAEQQQINAYFKKMDQAMEGQKYWSGSDGFAEQVAAKIQQGDYSELTRLSDTYARMERQAQAITPPPACRDYHQGTIEVLAKSQTLLSEMVQALSSGDPSGLGKLSSEAADLQQKCRMLDQEAASLQGGGAAPEQ